MHFLFQRYEKLQNPFLSILKTIQILRSHFKQVRILIPFISVYCNALFVHNILLLQGSQVQIKRSDIKIYGLSL